MRPLLILLNMGLSQKGKLEVKLKKEGDLLRFSICDDGLGFDLTDKITEESLGMSLIDGLVQQIDGEYEYNNEGGCAFRMQFSLD